MEFVGKFVEKEFKNFGSFKGLVESYDTASGFYKIVYEDGDIEELDSSELASLLGPTDTDRRRRSKRRRFSLEEDAGNTNSRETLNSKATNRVLDSNGNGSLGRINVDLNETIDKAVDDLGDIPGRSNLGETIDLNAGFNLNLNEGFDFDHGEDNLKRRECIDLNLDVNDNVMEDSKVVDSRGNCVDMRKRECGFDLNLGVDEEVKEYLDANCDAQTIEAALFSGRLEEVHVSYDASVGLAHKACKEDIVSGKDFRVSVSVEVLDSLANKEDQSEIIDANQANHGGRRRRGRRRLVDRVDTDSLTVLDCEKNCSITDVDQGHMGSAYKEVSSSYGKKRNVTGNVSSTPETVVLRRSSRKGSAKNDGSITSTIDDYPTVSTEASELTEEKTAGRQYKCHEGFVLPAKIQLPPSSKNLDLDGVPVLDLFSVYSCLRSFSTVLFLSPFELEEFVASLNSKSPSYLLSCIHVSILQTLRKHLEYLSSEGSDFASNCLRNLNWDFLDLITWPIFMVEYILTHLSELNPSFDVSILRLYGSDYHKQAASIKVQVLSCLCDAMMEVEVIRSELSRRSIGAEANVDFDRSVSNRSNKKRKVSLDVRSSSFATEETAENLTDWNSDECCLCKMDGSLICCDGCPAAYHSKCVGVASNLLPEGDWYCPECAIDRHKPWTKSPKSLRGAELLGVDPYGRQYLCTYGYLLVVDCYETGSSFNFYHKDNLKDVIEVLESSKMLHGGILGAIRKQWNIAAGLPRSNDNVGLQDYNTCIGACVPSSGLAASIKHGRQNEIVDEGKTKKIAGSCDLVDVELQKSVSPTYLSSEGSAETIITTFTRQNAQNEGPDFSNVSERPTKPLVENCLSLTNLDAMEENNLKAAPIPHVSLSGKKAKVNNTYQVQAGSGYNNYYYFGHTAFAVVEELMHKPSEKTKEQPLKTYEEIVSTQMKVISKKYSKFDWPNFTRLNDAAQKEKCGWCLPCRVPSGDSDCLFHINLRHRQKVPSTDIVASQSKRKDKGHLVDVACYVLLIEQRLQGLLLGPWLNPHYTRLWRKKILKASDMGSVKHLLLELELNMRPLVLSPEWWKPLDTATTIGSAIHIVTASSRASSKNGIGRKKARNSELEANPSSNSSGGLGILWWRGGRLSRKIYSWKVLPHSSVSKAARHAGCMKIPGIFYPENSDFAKRNKFVLWRAAVESSTAVEQLALQVRELDANIRWDEIENIYPLSMLDRGLKKSFRLFKKVIIRRKGIDGEGPRYLLDFGKRKAIPEVVLKNGVRVEETLSERKETLSERKKYWLNEAYVPLYLLKSFEEKRIARKSSKMASVEISEAGGALKRSSKNTGFNYLFAKAERPNHYLCGHCNKNVPVSDAVCCQYCQGFFHKRHVKKSGNSVVADCLYTCLRCHSGKYGKVKERILKGESGRGKNGFRLGKTKTKIIKDPQMRSKRGRPVSRIKMRLRKGQKSLRISRALQSQNNEIVSVVVPLRRSARKAKHRPPQMEIIASEERKQKKLKEDTSKKADEGISLRKRTPVFRSYWLNGLRFSMKPNDDRVIHFKRKCFLAPFESTILDHPKCHLCREAGYTPVSIYISCEFCGEWFHGDAFGTTAESVSKLIGFRCHICRKTKPPVCQNAQVIRGNELTTEGLNDAEPKLLEASGTPHSTEMKKLQRSPSNEGNQVSLPINEFLDREEVGSALDSNESIASYRTRWRLRSNRRTCLRS